MNQIQAKLNRLQKMNLVIGLLGAVGCGVGFILNRREFEVSYLFAFLFWVGLSLGCFYAAMIHYLTAGRWGFAARRVFEAGYMTLPLMAVLVVPVFFGLHELYPWALQHAVPTEKQLQPMIEYEKAPWFILRSFVFFAIWSFIAIRLRSWSLRQDTRTEAGPTIKIRTLSGPAVAIVPLTASLAFVDWAMSIEPDWHSTVFPVIVLAGQMLTAVTFVIVVLACLRNIDPFCRNRENTFHEFSNLLLAFVMFWTYVAFSQVLICYSANLPHEIDWYRLRIANDWIWIVGLIALLNFFAPFFLLLFRKAKMNICLLATVAAVVFFVHAIETFWVIAPNFYAHVEIHWTDFAAWFGIGGIWCAVFLGNLNRHPLLARNDPRMEELIAESCNAK